MLVLFALTIFIGAALLFLVQPMAAKSVLPLLGGSPAVWNTAMVFFQAALLAGYLGAHLLGRAGRRTQVIGYALAVAAPIAASLVLHRMIVDLPEGWSPPTHASPIPWALVLLAVMVGGPFIVLAGAGPLLQRWFAGTGHRSAADPYFLYVASNAGSMVGLLAYPFVVEPLLTLPTQRWMWSVGFGVFAMAAAACGVVFRRAGAAEAPPGMNPQKARGATPVPAAPAVDALGWRMRLAWVVLAFVPSSLMLGVTQYLSTDIAAAPLLWVIPLAVYLLTFIIAFARRAPVSSRDLEKLVPLILVALAVAFLVRGFHLPPAALFGLHLLGLLLVGLWCHTRLAEGRPSPERLTEFYLWVAVGGAAGGVFNALLSPMIFPVVIEYPLLVFAACLLRVRRDDLATLLRQPGSAMLDLAVPALLAAMALSLDDLFKSAVRHWSLEPFFDDVGRVLGVGKGLEGVVRLALAVGLPAFILYLAKKRPVRFALGMATVLAAAFVRPDAGSRLLHVDRTFFGVYRVEQNHWQTWITHGTTLHGVQWRDPARRKTPLSYYHPDGPIGRFFAALGSTLGGRVGLVGMGAGALAAYGKPGQRFTFHEIDPAVVRIAENPEYFTYLRDGEARYDVVFGDGRVTMAGVPDGEYGMIVLDAFSSDSIPVHLLTREAMALYLRKLRPGGVLAYHVSNQYMRLAPVIERAAADLGAAALVWSDDAQPEEMAETGRYPSVWAAVARRPEDLAPLGAEGRWRARKIGPETPLWTDDYSNILGVIGKKE